MLVLSLDISTKCGWSLLEGEKSPDAVPKIIHSGCIRTTHTIQNHPEIKGYPWGFLRSLNDLTDAIFILALTHKPDHIVIEDTNGGGGRASRYTQKALEFIHCLLLNKINRKFEVTYINSSDWRKAVNLQMSKTDKKHNRIARKIRDLKKSGNKDLATKMRKENGVRGKKTVKHLSVELAAEMFGLELLQKDNDLTDSLLLGTAFFRNAPAATGLVPNTKKSKTKKQ